MISFQTMEESFLSQIYPSNQVGRGKELASSPWDEKTINMYGTYLQEKGYDLSEGGDSHFKKMQSLHSQETIKELLTIN